MHDRCGFRLTLILAAAVAVAPAMASADPEADCYDAEVSARIVRQTPTVPPECDDCVVMRWPWIVDLHVRRVHAGEVTPGPLTALTLQHTYYRKGLGVRRWLLRRNTLGGFNMISRPEEKTLPRCSSDAPAATPFIRPPAGQTLDDLRREGEARYGREELKPALGRN